MPKTAISLSKNVLFLMHVRNILSLLPRFIKYITWLLRKLLVDPSSYSRLTYLFLNCLVQFAKKHILPPIFN